MCERNHYKVLNKGTLVHLTIPNLFEKLLYYQIASITLTPPHCSLNHSNMSTLSPQFEWLTVERTSGCALRKMEVILVL